MVEYGGIEALVGILKNPQLSQNSTNIVLEGLETILAIYGERKKDTDYNPYADRVEECGGLDVLEELCGNDKLDEGVYDMLANILQKYWICEVSELEAAVYDMLANILQKYWICEESELE